MTSVARLPENEIRGGVFTVVNLARKLGAAQADGLRSSMIGHGHAVGRPGRSRYVGVHERPTPADRCGRSAWPVRSMHVRAWPKRRPSGPMFYRSSS
jgi:hypothetical protein